MYLKNTFFISLSVVFSFVYVEAQKFNVPKLQRAVVRPTLSRIQIPGKKRSASYHPVFGYTKFPKDSGTATFFNVPERWRQIQVAPVLELGSQWGERYPQNIIDAYDLHCPVHIAQAVYLWRLANPNLSLRKNHPVLFQQAQLALEETINGQELYRKVKDYPAVKFLTWLLDENFKPRSYTQVVATLDSYPKHVVLNEVGFPVRTVRADEADLLDNLLMLSGEQQMEKLNNVGPLQRYFLQEYSVPFILTSQEKQAADQLAMLREEAYQLPQHPTTRQLIELAYNELESQALPYTNMPKGDNTLYMAYPLYAQSALSNAISQKLDQLDALGLTPEDAEYVDYVHLLVLNTMMRGTVLQRVEFGEGRFYNFYNHRIFDCGEVERTIWAFRELCNMLPNTEENVSHLYQLQQGIRVALGSWTYPDMPFLRADFEEKYFSSEPAEKIQDLRFWAHQLFSEADVHHLIDRNRK